MNDEKSKYDTVNLKDTLRVKEKSDEEKK